MSEGLGGGVMIIYVCTWCDVVQKYDLRTNIGCAVVHALMELKSTVWD